MPYIDPTLVRSPKGRLSNIEVIYDGGEGRWSLAKVEWDGKKRVGIRWNGGSDETDFPGLGNPQSRGLPTWFILPEELATESLKLAKKLSKEAQ